MIYSEGPLELKHWLGIVKNIARISVCSPFSTSIRGPCQISVSALNQRYLENTPQHIGHVRHVEHQSPYPYKHEHELRESIVFDSFHHGRQMSMKDYTENALLQSLLKPQQEWVLETKKWQLQQENLFILEAAELQFLQGNLKLKKMVIHVQASYIEQVKEKLKKASLLYFGRKLSVQVVSTVPDRIYTLHFKYSF